jgi:hypothetical protein
MFCLKLWKVSGDLVVRVHGYGMEWNVIPVRYELNIYIYIYRVRLLKSYPLRKKVRNSENLVIK